MMNLNNFKEKIPRTIFERGNDYSDFDETESMVKYREMITERLNAVSDRRGYIDCDHAPVAMSPVYDLLYRAEGYIGKGFLREAFNVAAAVAPAGINAIQNMDDSGGECGGAILWAFTIMGKILDASDDIDFRTKVFDWLLQQMNNPDYDGYGCADGLESLIFAEAKSGSELKKAYVLIDRLLENASRKNGWSKEYQTKKYLQYKARLFQKEGKDTEANRIIDDNLYLSDFREIRVNKYLDERNFNEAIRLVKEGIIIAANNNQPDTGKRWKVKLLKICEQINHVEEEKKIALELFFGYNHEIQFYRKLKSIFSPDEWFIERENIIKKLIDEKRNETYFTENFNQPLATVFIEEKLWDRLFDMVKQNPQIDTLVDYAGYLKSNYSDELIGFYKTAILDFGDSNTGRPAYRELAQYLEEMAKLDHGFPSTNELRSVLLVRHPYRSAMREELNKLWKAKKYHAKYK
ncbi:MAG: hypothetical protein Q8R96_00455 [Bacteroidota bacterium]|nr:hypothetical protein [Bacteroidota bacterium]